MGRICRTKAGRVLEWQSDATPDTLIKNAENAGFLREDVEEVEMSDTDYGVLAQLLPRPRTIYSISPVISALVIILEEHLALSRGYLLERLKERLR